MNDHDAWVQQSEERLRNERVVEERLGPFRTFKIGARDYDEMKRQALEVFDIADLISGKYIRQCSGCISFDGRHHCEGFWPSMFLDEAAAEIERLRELIKTWVDLADDPSVDSKAYVEAENELRKAVNKPLIKRT